MSVEYNRFQFNYLHILLITLQMLSLLINGIFTVYVLKKAQSPMLL